MLPLSEEKASLHSALKRKREFNLIASFLRPLLIQRAQPIRILEFGCGRAIAADLLSEMGSLVESDIYKDAHLALPPEVPFVLCSITETPFVNREFDVLVSNQVVEHISDLPKAFLEMRRIGKADALFVFAVPTPVWLVLSIPGKVWDKVENVCSRLLRLRHTQNDTEPERLKSVARNELRRGIWRRLVLHGHGAYPTFIGALLSFRPKSWRGVFSSHGFTVVREAPLLCYSSSRWPIIPTNRTLARLGLASSYLWILRT